MSSDRPAVYWDSCVTLAWLNGEGDDDQREAIAACVQSADDREIVIVTGELPYQLEILAARIKPKAQQMLARVQNTRKFQLIPFSPRIGERAAQIRDFFASSGGRMPDSIDALHLAYAIESNVAHFYTFDRGRKGGRSLLALSHNVAGYDLTIMEPPPPSQRRLF